MPEPPPRSRELESSSTCTVIVVTFPGCSCTASAFEDVVEAKWADSGAVIGSAVLDWCEGGACWSRTVLSQRTASEASADGMVGGSIISKVLKLLATSLLCSVLL